MNKLYFILLLSLFIGSCADEPRYPDLESAERVVDPKNENASVKMQFDCAAVSQVLDSTSLRTLYFLYEDNKVAVDNLPVCEAVPRSQWDKLHIPSSAFIASGGKWPSGSAYFYVEQKNNSLVVFKISSDELDGESGAPKEVYRVKVKI